jgi:hypothetical protein
MKKISLFVAAMGLVLVASMGQAQASGPNCSTGAKKTQYNTGKKLAEMIVKQAWLTVGEDPLRFDEMADAVRESVTTAIEKLQTQNPSDLVLCRAKGLSQGVCDALGAVQDGVEGVCLLDGEIWGELSADLYCSLSIAFGGLDVVGLLPAAPVDTLCGQSFVEGCQDSFADFSTGTPECVDFTVGGFVAVWTETQTNMCVFETEE